MKIRDSDEVMLAARGGDDTWVHADVAQALYDALKQWQNAAHAGDKQEMQNAIRARDKSLAMADEATP